MRDTRHDTTSPPQVINFTMPNTVKHYVHRVGRTARAGKVGRSVSLVGETERRMLKDIVKKAKTPVKARVLPQGDPPLPGSSVTDTGCMKYRTMSSPLLPVLI